MAALPLASPTYLAAEGAQASHACKVELDHCGACGLVWFDPLEMDALDKAGWVALLRMLVLKRPRELLPALLVDGNCPRCRQALRPVPQQTQHGRYLSLVCPDGHGHAQRDGALLASRGLFRPLLLAERVALATEKRQLSCLQCGAALDRQQEACGYCQSPAMVLDLQRLSVAVGLMDEGIEWRRARRRMGGS